MTSFKIGQRVIGPDAPPFVIAEMSGNHNQSLEVALQIVDAAAKAGAHALKLQTYTADTMTLDLAEGEFFIKDPGSLWAGSSLYELYEKAHTPWEWHAPIFARAKALGMLAFSTPFDETAVDFLESLDVPAYKIASFENTDLPLIRRVAATGKPLIISTGMASVAELDETVRAARAAGCRDLVLLKCTSTYPASPLNSHIRTIAHLQQLFGCQVGLSDHSMGVGVAVAAVALGATVVEKHFTLDRAAGGVDASFSLEPAELTSLVVETGRAWQALGQVRYGATEAEQKSLIYRRSLYVVQDVAKGEPFTAQNVRAIRPGLGLAPKHVDAVLGRNARVALKRGTPLVWSAIE
ncbi:pseudaminic acid synthase [Pseudomonas asplenii]|uniref:N-acetylneuraminate synthase n=1 Tax=Pseudomonas asplenii TaxID=53407 RepID=A0A1H6PEH3_9PSED|nr:pseudaminic acid synthase [Pseudomonas fuscovaginae]SEI24026.1 N-acetylneuraminate synthase [Pseudomonas fuscovaginae]